MSESGKRSHSFLHPGVLQVEIGGSRRWTMAMWSIPKQASEFRRALSHLIRATLVLEWIQPLRQGDDSAPTFASVDLVFYADPATNDDVMAELEALGFAPVSMQEVTPKVKQRLTVFQSEARRQNRESPGDPVAIYRLGVEHRQGELAQRLDSVRQRVESNLGGLVWGDEPGRLSKELCDQLQLEFQTRISPTPTGLAMLEDLLVETRDEIGWVHPVFFQAICDFLGVVLQGNPDLEVQWSLCAVDDRTGLAPPPILRLRRRGGPWHTSAIGQEVVECIALPWSEQTGRQLVALEEKLREAVH